MKLSELQVDAEKLLERASFSGWRNGCLQLLWSAAKKSMPMEREAQEQLPMKHVSYADWAERVNGFGRLAAVESLVQLPRLKVGGEVLLAMATEIFLPHLPKNHPAWLPSSVLLECFDGYLSGEVPAEAYIETAYRYRLNYGPRYCSLMPDAENEHLFEAMPSQGLDHAVPHQCWSLAAHWLSFGKHLAARGERWKALMELEDAAGDAEFVTGDQAANDEARDSLQGLIEVQLDALVHGALEGFDDALRGLVDRVVAECCGETDPNAVPVPDYIERLRAERAAHHPLPDTKVTPQKWVIPPASLEAARESRAARRAARQQDPCQGESLADTRAFEAVQTDPGAPQQGEEDQAPGPDAAI